MALGPEGVRGGSLGERIESIGPMQGEDLMVLAGTRTEEETVPSGQSDSRRAGGGAVQRSPSYLSSTGTFDGAPGTSRTSLGTR